MAQAQSALAKLPPASGGRVVKGSQEYWMQGAAVTLLVCIKNTGPDNWGVGGKHMLLWPLWRHEKGRVLALRLALVLTCLFFCSKVSPTELFVCVSLWQKDQGTTSEELKLQTAFSKNNKDGRKKESSVSESLSQIKRHERRHCRGESNLRKPRSPSLSLNRRGNRGQEKPFP